MNKTIINVTIVFLTLAILFSLTGCSGNFDIQSNNPVNIAFVVGIADNETKLNEGINELSNLPASPGTDYAFISIEGEPTTIGEAGTIPDLSDRGYTDVMMERVRAGIMADLTERLASYVPTTSEIDIAEATELAVRTLNAHTTEDRQNLLVYYCGGKSTSGLINMIESPVYSLDVEGSVDSVARNMNADMSGIDVIWYCCGDFGNGQPKLSANEKAQLKSFYEKLFDALGAKSVTFRDNLPSAESYCFPATPVSIMDVEGTVSGLKNLVALTPDIFVTADTSVLENPIVIPEDQVRYKPDSAEFLNSDAAMDAIQPVAAFLAANPDVNILLYGTCAGDADSSYTLRLGKARAESVKHILVESGIDENRITAVTVKVVDDPYYQFGLGIGADASVNRKCVMMDMSTALAQQLLENAV